MRITENQLRRVVRKLVNEQTQKSLARSWDSDLGQWADRPYDIQKLRAEVEAGLAQIDEKIENSGPEGRRGNGRYPSMVSLLTRLKKLMLDALSLMEKGRKCPMNYDTRYGSIADFFDPFDEGMPPDMIAWFESAFSNE